MGARLQRLVALVVAAALGPLAADHASAAGPCTDQSTVDGGVYRYALCGVPDLDQVRPAGPGFVGLSNSGRSHCVPTATMNLFAYLADRGLPYLPGAGDWRDMARYNEMTALIASLGSHMGTSGSGTGAEGWLKGTTTWLGITPKNAGALPPVVMKGFAVGGHGIDTDFETARAFAPHPADVAAHAVGGDLVIGVIGFYRTISTFETLDGGNLKNVLERKSGHATTVVGATATATTTKALLGIRDPSSPWLADHTQSEYVTDVWSLDAVQPERRFVIATKEGVRAYEAAVPSVGGEDTTRFDGYFTLEPQRAVAWDGHRLVVHTPRPLTPGQPVARVVRAPGRRRITDVALAPQSGHHAFLVEGSRTIYRGDPLTGRVRAVGTAPAGRAQIALGGAKEIVFAAAGSRVVALSPRDGRVLRTTKLAAPVADLQVDGASGRVVALEQGARRVTILEDGLRRSMRLRLTGPVTGGSGRPSLSLAPGGALLVSRAGSAQVTVVPATAARAARTTRGSATRSRTVRSRVRRLAVEPSAGPIAVDDRGHLFVTRGGKIVELTASGRRVPDSPFAGLRAGQGVVMSRSVSHVPPGFALDDARDLTRPFAAPPPADPGPAPDPPPSAPPPAPAKPNLVLGTAELGSFTVRNAGGADAGAFTVAVLDPNGTQQVQIDGLAAGATSQPIAHNCPLGYPMRAQLDANAEVDESTEDDNLVSLVCPD